jgi:transcriptional regulator with XRE-family HTH domain
MSRSTSGELKKSISGAQIRAARGLLDWTRHELARRAVVSDASLYTLENARGAIPNTSTLEAVQKALEAAGIEFDGPAPGPRLRPKPGDDPIAPPTAPTSRSPFAEAGGPAALSGSGFAQLALPRGTLVRLGRVLDAVLEFAVFLGKPLCHDV